MRFFSALAATGFLLTATSTMLMAQSPCTTLAGVVNDSSASPVAGARVTLDEKSPRATDANGRFEFPCVRDGRHAVA